MQMGFPGAPPSRIQECRSLRSRFGRARFLVLLGLLLGTLGPLVEDAVARDLGGVVFSVRDLARLVTAECLVCEDGSLLSLLSQNPWILLKSVLVMDFAVADNRQPVAMDLEISPNGWELTLFGRNRSEPYLAQLIEASSQLHELKSCERASNGRRIVKRWDLDAKIEDIHAFLAQFIRQVDEAMRAFQGL